MTDTVSFFVEGVPVPQGSKTRTPQGYFREANKKTKPWRKNVAGAATAAMTGKPKIEGPVALEANFLFPRPKHHFGTGRNANRLKPSAPHWHEIAPDGDKLARAIGDSLTGIVFKDDAQIAAWTIWKKYAVEGDKPGASIKVLALTTLEKAA